MIDFWDSGTDFNQVVNVDWLQTHFTDPRTRLVDARSAREYAAGHLPAAVHWDMNALRLPDSSPESLATFQHSAASELIQAGAISGERVIFYDDFSGATAARGVWLLDYLGVATGAMLDGGLTAWRQTGGEISTESRFPEPGRIDISIQPELLTGVDEILTGISGSSDSVTVLNTRSDLEFRIGTIPTSIHLEWLQNLTPNGTLRSKDELRELYRQQGLTPEPGQSVVTFCGGGYRAAHSYLVLKELGFSSVKNYAPSWGEWGQRSDLPVERPGAR